MSLIMCRTIMKKQVKGTILVTRKNNPDYVQVTGLIKRELAVALKFYCVEQGLNLTEGLEEAIESFLKSKGKLSEDKNI